MRYRPTALDGPIFGVDVHSGDVRGEAPSFALVILADGEAERSVVTFRKLQRLIADREPAIVAVDNVYELASDKDDLIRLLRRLPHATRLVQVTGADRPEPLSRVADRHDVPYGKDPMQEAEAAARLAAARVGYEVRAFADTTTIKVSRGRSTGKGGWSEDRFTRRIHGAVKRRSRVVEDALEARNLSFEVDVTEKYGGYANAIFTVEAPPEALPVGNERSGDVRIEIEREQRDGIEFEPLATRRDFVVVGIDPGTTTAVAIVDVDGEVLDVYSTRTDDTAAVIEWIIEHGRPFLVAADVTPMPQTVEKIRRSFDAAGWTPASDLLVDRKQHRTRDLAIENDHERDAVAAALFAVDDHRTQFDRIAAKVPPTLDPAEVIARVVSDGASISETIADLDPDEEEPAAEPAPAKPNEPTPERRRIRELERRVERLTDHVDDLEATVAEKDDRIDELEAELSAQRERERRDVRERREVTRLRREKNRLSSARDEWRETAEGLEAKLERLKSLWRLDHSNFADVDPDKRGLVPVKPVEKFTTEAIRAADESFGLVADDVILLRDASGAGRPTAEELVAIGPRAVITDGGMPDVAREVLYEAGIPFGDDAGVRIQEIDDLAVASETDVERLIEDWRERAAARERDRKAALVDRVISEHRANRRPSASN